MKRSIIVVIIIVVAALVPAGVYTASPLFINTTIDEPAPITRDMINDKSSTEMPTEDDVMMESEKLISNDDIMIEKELTGSFVGAGDGIHNAEGMVKIIHVAEGNNVLRLENLSVTNGPDLYVYLATDKQASEFVSLGRLKANHGNQNYNIPEGTDLSKYDNVLVWCQQFSVLFGNAELTSGMST